MTDYLERAEASRERTAGAEYEARWDLDPYERFSHEIEEAKREADPEWTEEDEEDE